MIEANSVSFHYGVRPVLKDVTLKIAKGEVAAVIGPNGSGKSTLLSVLGGVVPARQGEVMIDGKRRRASIKSERAIRNTTVYLPTEVFLPSAMSGREYLLSVARMYKVTVDRAISHAESLLRLFCLGEMADSNIASYSTGQKKKVGLCGALITDAECFLLDEPFSGGLDPAGILAMKRVLQTFRDDRERTVVFTTPVAEIVDETADRLFLIREGEIVGDHRIESLKLDGSKSVTGVVEEMVFPNALDAINDYIEFAGATA